MRSRKHTPGWIGHRARDQLNRLLCENAFTVQAMHRLSGKQNAYKSPEHELKFCHSRKLQCYRERQILSRA